MDQELTRALASLSAQLSEVGRDARSAATEARHLAVRVEALERVVYPSTPPTSGAPTRLPVVAARVTDAEAGLDRAHGMALAIDAKVEALGAAVARVEAANREQSRAFGVGVQGLRFLFRTREGRKMLLHVATAIGVAYAATRTPAPQAPPAAPSAVVR